MGAPPTCPQGALAIREGEAGVPEERNRVASTSARAKGAEHLTPDELTSAEERGREWIASFEKRQRAR